ncbi:MAG: hypothetical protein AAF662_00575 [Pseudomonadota bacterium]
MRVHNDVCLEPVVMGIMSNERTSPISTGKEEGCLCDIDQLIIVRFVTDSGDSH